MSSDDDKVKAREKLLSDMIEGAVVTSDGIMVTHVVTVGPCSKCSRQSPRISDCPHCKGGITETAISFYELCSLISKELNNSP